MMILNAKIIVRQLSKLSDDSGARTLYVATSTENNQITLAYLNPIMGRVAVGIELTPTLLPKLLASNSTPPLSKGFHNKECGLDQEDLDLIAQRWHRRKHPA